MLAAPQFLTLDLMMKNTRIHTHKYKRRGQVPQKIQLVATRHYTNLCANNNAVVRTWIRRLINSQQVVFMFCPLNLTNITAIPCSQTLLFSCITPRKFNEVQRNFHPVYLSKCSLYASKIIY